MTGVTVADIDFYESMRHCLSHQTDPSTEAVWHMGKSVGIDQKLSSRSQITRVDGD